jgi:hypothetical protein
VIADAIHRRFIERYLQPASDATASGRGCAMMAIACLMVAALESFRHAAGPTHGAAGKASTPSARSSTLKTLLRHYVVTRASSTKVSGAVSSTKPNLPLGGGFVGKARC